MVFKNKGKTGRPGPQCLVCVFSVGWNSPSIKRALIVPLPPCCPHSAGCSPITILSPLFSANHFHNSFFFCLSLLLSLGYAQPTTPFETTGAPLFSHLGEPKPPTHTFIHPTHQSAKWCFSIPKTEVKSVHHVPCRLLFTVTKMIGSFKTEAAYVDWRAKYVTEVSVKNVSLGPCY